MRQPYIQGLMRQDDLEELVRLAGSGLYDIHSGHYEIRDDQDRYDMAVRWEARDALRSYPDRLAVSLAIADSIRVQRPLVITDIHGAVLPQSPYDFGASGNRILKRLGLSAWVDWIGTRDELADIMTREEDEYGPIPMLDSVLSNNRMCLLFREPLDSTEGYITQTSFGIFIPGVRSAHVRRFGKDMFGARYHFLDD
jgi:hypothetical protein